MYRKKDDENINKHVNQIHIFPRLHVIKTILFDHLQVKFPSFVSGN